MTDCFGDYRLKKSRIRLGIALVVWAIGSFLFLMGLNSWNANTEALPTVAPVAQLPDVTTLTEENEGVGDNRVPVLSSGNADGEGVATETAVFVPSSPNTQRPQTNSEIEPTETFAAFGVRSPVGSSAEGRLIESYRFGFGTDVIIFVGGMHGGYEWNTILLAYEAIDYFVDHPEAIPYNISLYIIPVANPDGQFEVTGKNGRFSPEDVAEITIPGRFNGNDVDLNRNWDCEWQADAVWNSRAVDAGSGPFSEPETKALRRFFLRQNPELVVFWHSKADGVYAGSCEGPFAGSIELGQLFAEASDYNFHRAFTAYEVTGEASDWLATEEISSFTVELTVHDETEWEQNLAGMLAVLAHFGD